jgi:hypothetical protein
MSDSPSDLVEDSEGGKLSPFSCANCRRGHRKCDRKLPVCTECVGKRKKCVYELPQKRGPKGRAAKTSNYQPYPTVNVPNIGMPSNLVSGLIPDSVLLRQQMTLNNDRERELVRRFLVTQHLDLEYENIIAFIPVMPPYKVKELLAYIRDQVCTYSSEYNPELPPPTNAELALVFAIEAVSFTTQGHPIIARHLYDKSRSFLNNIFEDVLYDFNVAATYGYLATFLITNDETNRANFFLQNAQKYVDTVALKFVQEHVAMPTCQSVKSQFLTYLVKLCETQMDEKWDIPQLFLDFILSFKMYRSYATLEDHYLPSAIRKLIEPIDEQAERALALVEENIVTKKYNYDLNLENIDLLTRNQNKLFDKILSNNYNLPQNDIVTKKLILSFFSQGAKLRYLQSVGRDMDLLTFQIANNITAFTRHPNFPLCIELVAATIILAADVQVKFFENSPQDSQMCNEILDLLREDMQALKLLKERYKIVGTKYGGLMQGLEKFIDDNEQKQQLFAMYSRIKQNQRDLFVPSSAPNSATTSSTVSPSNSHTGSPFENMFASNSPLDAPKPNIFAPIYSEFTQASVNIPEFNALISGVPQSSEFNTASVIEDPFSKWVKSIANSNENSNDSIVNEQFTANSENLESFLNDLLWIDNDGARSPDVISTL